MTHILYRENALAGIPAANAIKNQPLTNAEIDGNFRSLQIGIAANTAELSRATHNNTGGTLVKRNSTGEISVGSMSATSINSQQSISVNESHVLVQTVSSGTVDIKLKNISQIDTITAETFRTMFGRNAIDYLHVNKGLQLGNNVAVPSNNYTIYVPDTTNYSNDGTLTLSRGINSNPLLAEKIIQIKPKSQDLTANIVYVLKPMQIQTKLTAPTILQTTITAATITASTSFTQPTITASTSFTQPTITASTLYKLQTYDIIGNSTSGAIIKIKNNSEVEIKDLRINAKLYFMSQQ